MIRIGDVRERAGSSVPFGSEAQHVRFELDLTKLNALSNEQVPQTKEEVFAFVDAQSR